MKKRLYILVADNGRAKIFRAEIPLESLDVVYDYVNFQGRKKNTEIYSDRPGMQSSGRGGYHSFAGERDNPEEDKFSRELCKILCDDHRRKRFDNLILIAPPHFMGSLRKHLKKECGDVLLKTIDKDLVQMEKDEIFRHLQLELTARD